MISEKVQVATTIRPKVAMLTSGMDRSVVAMKRGNARGARGAGHPLYDPFIVANRQRDEPLGCSGGRQPSSGGTSRMTGDRLVRICEGSREKFPRSTRRSRWAECSWAGCRWVRRPARRIRPHRPNERMTLMSWQAVLYFLLWSGAFALMMRFGCGAHVMGHGHGGPSSDTGSGSQGGVGAGELEKTVDPVCGMPVRKAEAKTSAYQGDRKSVG